MGEHHLRERLQPVSLQSVDQLDLSRVHGDKAGIQAEDAPEDRHRHPGDDDRRLICPEPDDQERGKGRFGKAVQDDDIRVQYLRELPAEPETDGGQHADQDDQDEAYDRLVEGDPHMEENALVSHHLPEAQGDLRRAAEDKRVDPANICGKFPQKQETEQDQYPRDVDDPLVLFLAFQEIKLFFGKFTHRSSAPSISG